MDVDSCDRVAPAYWTIKVQLERRKWLRESTNFRSLKVTKFLDWALTISLEWKKFWKLCSMVQQKRNIRVTWSFWKRISISFTFTIICVVDVAVCRPESRNNFLNVFQIFSPDFAPTPQFAVILEGIARDLYGIDKDARVVIVGSTGTYVDLNVSDHTPSSWDFMIGQDGRSLITLLLYLVLAPYILSYGLFVCLVVLVRPWLDACPR